jgi:hypothetical protein
MDGHLTRVLRSPTNSRSTGVAIVVALFLSGFLFAAPAIAAQQAEVVRGRVIDDSARALVGATVMVTRGPDRLTLHSTTDSSGDYRIRFDTGTGDYLVYISATGFKSARRRVQRQGSERELVADFALSRDLTTLAAVKVTAEKPVPATNEIRPTQLEPGSSEKWNDGVSGALAPTVAGDQN